MTFLHPYWLYIGAASCAALTLLMFWSGLRRTRNLQRFVGVRHLSKLIASLSPGRRRFKQAALVLGLFCLFVALARPQWGYHLEEAKREGLDLILAVDTSKSMLAEDMRPNRLARAKLAVEELSERLDGARLGLIAFAGDAFLQTPLTLDRNVFSLSLSALDTSIIPIGGTDVAAAIRAALDAFSTEPTNRKIMVLLTDGEDLEGNALEAAEEAKKGGLTIYTVGIGTAQGEPIPVTDEHGGVDLMRDASGQPVQSRLDEGTLREIAQITAGAYQALGQSGQGLETLYRDHLAKLPTRTVTSRMTRVYHEQFQWPLALGLLLLLLEPMVGERRTKRGTTRALQGVTVGASALSLMLVALPPQAHALEPEAPVSLYNGGTRLYRDGAFDQAAEHFSRALSTPDTTLQHGAYYNLGNARYRLGQGTLTKDPSQTTAHWRRAIEAYDAALALAPDDEDARFNRDLVARKLAELEQHKQSDEGKQSGQDEQQGQNQQSGEDEQPSESKQSGQDRQSGQDEQGGQHEQERKDEQRGQGEQTNQGQQQAGGEQQDPARQQGGSSQPDRAGQDPAQDPKQGSAAGSEKLDAQADPSQGDPPQSPQEAAAHAQANQATSAQAQASSENEAPAVPGGLSRFEAAQLLDSLEGELQRLPFAYGDRSEQSRSDPRSRKDW